MQDKYLKIVASYFLSPLFLILLVPFLILQKNVKNVNIFVQNASFLKKITCMAKKRPKSSPKEGINLYLWPWSKVRTRACGASIQTAATKVTDIGAIPSLGASPCQSEKHC